MEAIAMSRENRKESVTREPSAGVWTLALTFSALHFLKTRAFAIVVGIAAALFIISIVGQEVLQINTGWEAVAFTYMMLPAEVIFLIVALAFALAVLKRTAQMMREAHGKRLLAAAFLALETFATVTFIALYAGAVLVDAIADIPSLSNPTVQQFDHAYGFEQSIYDEVDPCYLMCATQNDDGSYNRMRFQVDQQICDRFKQGDETGEWVPDQKLSAYPGVRVTYLPHTEIVIQVEKSG